MKILYINHYAGSPKYGMEFRPYYLAKEWVKLGHEVIILGADYSHLRTVQPSISKDLSEENIEGIKYFWLKTPVYKSSGIKRIVNILSFVLKLFKYKSSIVKKVNPDVVITSSTYPLDIYPAYLIAKKNNAKLVFELHDMWPLTPIIIGGYSRFHPFIWLIQMAENFACKHCNYYVSMLGNTEEYLIKHGLKPGKYVHITNGYSESEWSNNNDLIPSEHLVIFSMLKNENKVIIGYAGGHAPSNSLEVLIDAANVLRNENIAFVLVGQGSLKDKMINKAMNYNLNNVYFLPPVIKTVIPSILKYFDIAFIAGVKSELHKYGTAANKVTDYMLAKKPIIFSVDEPNSLVERVGCGMQIPAENLQELVTTIKLLCTLSVDERLEIGEKGFVYAKANLNYSFLASKFIRAIENC